MRQAISGDRGDIGKADIDPREAYAGFERRIKAVVKAGKMTRQEAKKQLDGFKRRLGAAEKTRGKQARGDSREADFKAIEARVIAAVKAGKMSREEAGKVLEDAKKRMEVGKRSGEAAKRGMREAPRARSLSIEDYRAAEARMKKAVAAGEMNAEDAKARLSAMRKMIIKKK